jgi:hypothetical protein
MPGTLDLRALQRDPELLIASASSYSFSRLGFATRRTWIGNVDTSCGRMKTGKLFSIARYINQNSPKESFSRSGPRPAKLSREQIFSSPLKRWQFATRLSRNTAHGILRKVSTLFFTAAATSKLNLVVCDVLAGLPRKQSRVLTWPLATVFGFIAQPDTHIFLKPTVTRLAATEYGFDFLYRSRPSWETYSSLLVFADEIRRDLRDLRPRDLIDIQSFIWVLGSDEYEE